MLDPVARAAPARAGSAYGLSADMSSLALSAANAAEGVNDFGGSGTRPVPAARTAHHYQLRRPCAGRPAGPDRPASESDLVRACADHVLRQGRTGARRPTAGLTVPPARQARSLCRQGSRPARCPRATPRRDGCTLRAGVPPCPARPAGVRAGCWPGWSLSRWRLTGGESGPEAARTPGASPRPVPRTRQANRPAHQPERPRGQRQGRRSCRRRDLRDHQARRRTSASRTAVAVLSSDAADHQLVDQRCRRAM